MAFANVVSKASNRSNTAKMRAEQEKRQAEGVYEQATRMRVAKFVAMPQKDLNKLGAFKSKLLAKAAGARGKVSATPVNVEHQKKMMHIREFSKERKLGDRSRFGDGDGSWWDRWLCHHPPPVSSLSSGYAHPKSGFKRRGPKRFTVPITKADVKNKAALTRAFQPRGNLALDAGRRARRDTQASNSDKSDIKEFSGTKDEGNEGDDFLDNFNTQAAREKAERFEKMVAASTTRLLKLANRRDQSPALIASSKS